ncbi:Rhodanese domain protein [Arcobacter nitrofigilis DSM 7299]|uniref:Rhodanese domain protein n=1 Tax=Arcobacter nitrofigilis (strain ATCC 33309 / DSM 7299 / CCUG 15893 / LMG 7604 / NCTC 12251 / CI) TaxID=572480 RepID=D5V190_ARCNC|nr:rhodanese-like domain-containing protein [Arcobacter nitrofigilis]ADG94052.1 Rhodanese domain protein [Arcobacter nitrofigilis DSM 7299]
MKIIGIVVLTLIVIFLIYKYIQVSNIDKNSNLISTAKGIILDVRPNKAYESNHIKGAINISMNDIFEGAYKSLDKKQTYYIYCYLGLMSIKVSTFLKEKGFENIINCGPMSEVNKYINCVK